MSATAAQVLLPAMPGPAGSGRVLDTVLLADLVLRQLETSERRKTFTLENVSPPSAEEGGHRCVCGIGPAPAMCTGHAMGTPAAAPGW